MIETALLNEEEFFKMKYKNFIKKKKKKLKLKEMNYNFVIKVLFVSFIILLMIFLFIKIRIFIKKMNNKYLYLGNNSKSKSYFACFCAKAREENIYAKELISYYSKLGVGKFIFGDNNLNGTEKLEDVLKDYVKQSNVDIYEIYGLNIGQAEFNQIIYEKYKARCGWFLFFDFDEYLDIHFENNISLTLQDFLTNNTFDKCEAILFNWLIYTDNDLIYYDNRTLLERFPVPKYNLIDNTIVKSIVRGGLNKTIFYPKKSNHVPDANLKICNSIGTILTRYNPFSVSPPIYKYGALKHFTTKTAEEYANKTRRGGNRNIAYKPEDRVKLFFRFNKFSQEKLNFFEKQFNKSFRIINKIS